MKDSLRPYAVVDLFAGPGGLGEGFAALRGPEGNARFRTVLSVDNDRHAYQTLLLRAFLRKFENGFPDEYYQYINGELAEPNWEELAPEQWREAVDETRCLELGTTEASEFLAERVESIRRDWDDRTVLIGGPPCQAYSVVGRSRNAKRKDHLKTDQRYGLYRQYMEVLAQLRPAVAVMENVKGILSASLDGQHVFPVVLAGLRYPQNDTTYRTYALCPRSRNRSLLDHDDDPSDFVVRTEEHGIPQARHRVFVVCVRRDIADGLPDTLLPRLDSSDGRVSVADVIGTMPKLRSQLSRGDSQEAWCRVVVEACELVRDVANSMDPEQARAYRLTVSNVLKAARAAPPPTHGPTGFTAIPKTCPESLCDWLFDKRIERLPNNETRSHMPADLVRYLFAAAFASACGRSPKTPDFPKSLAAKHSSWSSGSFDDRFRVQLSGNPATTVTSHLAKDGHYFIHPDAAQVRSFTVREAARVQTFPDDYFFCGPRTSQYVQVGNAVPPFLALQIAESVWTVLEQRDRPEEPTRPSQTHGAREPVALAAAAVAAS